MFYWAKIIKMYSLKLYTYWFKFVSITSLKKLRDPLQQCYKNMQQQNISSGGHGACPLGGDGGGGVDDLPLGCLPTGSVGHDDEH